MRARSLMLVLAGCVALAPLAWAQDHAVPRGGGGGGSSGGGGGHPGVSSSGGGSSSGGSSSGYSGGSSSGSGSSGSSGSASTAERRHPRAGTGRGSYGGGGYYPGNAGYWGSSWYYPGWGYGSYWWPYGSYGWYGGYWGYPWGWGGGGAGTMYRYADRDGGSIRVLVDPAEARVYVDGYYAGSVDDFDGLFQRLNLSPGRHEIALKLEGYKTHRMKVHVPTEGTLKLRYDLQKGSGESFEDLSGNAPDEARPERDRESDDRWIDRERRDNGDASASVSGGRLRLTVRPADASVYVDGAFRGTGREASSLQLSPGRHRIEVVRPGFRTDEREVEVTAGDTTEVTFELEKGSI